MQASGDVSVKTNYALGISQYEKSRDIFQQLGDTPEAGIAEIWALQYLPDATKVGDGRRRLLAFIGAAQERKFKVLLAPAYYWLAIGEGLQSEISGSNKHSRTALHLAEESDNAFEVQHVQDSLASNYSEFAELEPALLYADKMLNERDLYYQSAIQYWREKETLSRIALKLGFSATALNLAQEALAIAQETWPGRSIINDSLHHLLAVAEAKEDFAAALRYANESLQLALPRSNTAENTRMTAGINLLMADLKSKENDCSEALNDYDRALGLYADVPEVTNSLYLVHKGKLFCFAQLDRQEDFAAELKTVLSLSEQYRTTIREDDSRQAFFASEQVVYDLAAVNALKQNDSRAAFAYVEESKSRSLLDFVESKKTINEVEKDFGPVARPLALTEIQARLPEQVQIIQYAVLSDRLALWVISKSRFDLIERPITAANLEQQINDYHNSVVRKAPIADINRSSRALYDLLIPAGLDNAKQLCIISDTSLHQLAFASLIAASGRYLIQDFSLSYAPSASVLVLATENARLKESVTKETLLSVGNPDFDREENPNLADLRDAESEARTIGAAYPGSEKLIGKEATRDRFLQSIGKVEVIHFAGHFVANPQSPGNSKLLFAGRELRSNELSAYKLPRAKLVVLSACETGFERYSRSEGAIGIARTLLALGSPLVVASQWKVDSEPTKDLMIAFHRNRKEKGMTSAESLRQGQLEMLGKSETKEPFYWAAFSLFGGYASY